MDQNNAATTAYNLGVSLVYRGRRLDSAAESLGEAVRLEPKNPEYRLALGCAFARRAVVIRWAAVKDISYEAEQVSYTKRYTAWEQAQSDKNSTLFGADPPLLPTPAITSDDGKVFTLTPKQAKERANDLCRRAKVEWDVAVVNARTDAERANVHFVRGWGMIVIKRIGSIFVQTPDGSPTFGQYAPWLERELVPDLKHIVEEFQAALAISPENARYWQSLGDSYVADTDPKAWSIVKAIAAYEKALKLDRRSPTLWYQTYTLQEQSDPSVATDAIRKAADADPSNAFYWYILANLLLKSYAGNGNAGTDTDKAVADSRSLAAGLDALAKGNAGTFRPTAYQYAVPKILAPLNPDNNWVSDALYGDYILSIPKNAAIAIKADIVRQNFASGITTARTVVLFSDRMLALADMQTDPNTVFLAWTFGGIAIHSSYTSLIEVLERVGNTSAVAEARAKMRELDALAQKRIQHAN